MNSHRLNLVALALMSYVAVFAAARYQGARSLLGAQFDFLPGLVVVGAMLHGLSAVFVVAIVGGCLFDSISANPLGVTTFSLGIVGAAVFFNRELLLRDQIYPQFILGAGASAAAPVLSYLGVSALGGHPLIDWATLWVWLMVTVMGGLATPMWFAIFRKVERALHYQVIPESTIRADREIDRGRS